MIGGGIVGLATAIRLEQKFPDADVTRPRKRSLRWTAPDRTQQRGPTRRHLLQAWFRKGPTCSSRNSADGRILPAARHPHEICGKLIVASHRDEIPRLHELYDVAKQWAERAGNTKSRTDEGNRASRDGVSAIRVPQEGIVDYVAVAAALARNIRGQVVTNAKVMAIRQTSAAGCQRQRLAILNPTC